jgi:hypothetical protein
MEFGAKYEILKSLTRGDVEAFAVCERTSGEKLLAYIFPCSEPPPDQPTAQWILACFAKLAPQVPGPIVKLGKYDVASFAYIVTSWPEPAILEAWIDQYHKESGLAPASSSLEPAIDAAAPPTNQQAPVVETIVSEALPVGQAEQRVSEHFVQADEHDEALLEPPGSQPREPGEFTRQFFREVGWEPEQARLGNGHSSSVENPLTNPLADKLASLAGSGPAPRNGANAFPDPGAGTASSDLPTGFSSKLFEQAGKPETASPNDEFGPGKVSSGEFTRFFQAPSAKQAGGSGVAETSAIGPTTETGEFLKMFGSEAPTAPEEAHVQPPVEYPSASLQDSSTAIFSPNSGAKERSPIGPGTETGDFSRMFGAEIPGAAEEPHLEPPIVDRSSVSYRDSSTGIFSHDSGAAVRPPTGPATDSGGFTQIFGSERSRAAEEMNLQSPVLDRAPAPVHGFDSSTEIFNRDISARGERLDSSYNFDAKTGAQPMDESGSTQIFAEPRRFPATSSPITNPGFSSSDAMPSPSRLEAAADGGATILFRPPAEAAAEAEGGSRVGPSEYTRFMSREELSASVLQSGDSIAPPSSSSSGGAAAAAGLASQFVTPPAVPSYQVPPLPVPAYPAAPAIPGGAAPAMPSVAPPAIAVPPMPAPAGQPASGPKSYLPLIIALNVLFLLAVLLVLYFVLRHH